MGEAKRKLEATRAAFLKELDEWSFEPSEWEAETVAQLSTLSRVQVNRYPDARLEWMRMPPRQCHANARFMEENDPEGRLKQVTGWWPQDGHFVLHSVVDQHGKYMCVTPAPQHPQNPFEFIPDCHVEWREEGDYRVAYRNGVKIGPGVRADPASSTAEVERIRRLLLSGVNPYQAMRAQG